MRKHKSGHPIKHWFAHRTQIYARTNGITRFINFSPATKVILVGLVLGSLTLNLGLLMMFVFGLGGR